MASKLAQLTEETKAITAAVNDPTSPWPDLTPEDKKTLQQIAFRYNGFRDKIEKTVRDDLSKMLNKIKTDIRNVQKMVSKTKDPVVVRHGKSLIKVLEKAYKQLDYFFIDRIMNKEMPDIGQADYQARWMLDPFRT